MARSTKSAETIDRETSALRNYRAEIAELTKLLEEARRERDFFKANSLRKEGIIQMLQKKIGRIEPRPRVDTGRTWRERCMAYLNATGERSVTSTRLLEWEQQQAG